MDNPEDILYRQGDLEDVDSSRDLFAGSIRTVCAADYTPEQIEAWVSGADDIERWQHVFKHQWVRMAVVNGRAIGFVTLQNDHHIDMFFVHKDYQRKGIAQSLFAQAESEAIRQGSRELTAHVSITARPFFERMGFRIKKRQTVIRRGIELTNFQMVKSW